MRGWEAGRLGGWEVLLIAIAACHTPRNAPGNVDLTTPPAFERGDPAAYAPPTDPGENVLGVMPSGWFMGGAAHGMDGGAFEGGASMTLAFGERDHSGGFAFPLDSWGGTVGWAFVQEPGDKTATEPARMGPVSAEVSRLWHGTMTSAGVAVRPSAHGVDVGGQVSLQLAIFAVRMRMMQDGGFEVFAGYQLPVPLSVTWSR